MTYPFEGVSTPNPERAALMKSVRVPSDLADVAAAVSEASRYCRLIYVERLGEGWRWSLAHPGGPYPLLRETARFLQIDYRQLLMPFRTVAPAVAVIDPGPGEAVASALLRFTRDTGASQVQYRIRRRAAFAPYV